MEKYKCKLCSRTFINGKALGGHMKAHFATLPISPPNPQPQTPPHHTTPSSSTLFSFSSSSSEAENTQETMGKTAYEKSSLIYRLRKLPKKSFKLSDPKFSFSTTETIVHDRESETESNNPTQKRKLTFGQNSEQKKLKHSLKDSHSQLTETETEPEPVTSLFNFSPEEEAAITLMMLSRDKWKINVAVKVKEEEQEVCGKYKSHKSICLQNETNLALTSSSDHKIFQCVFCP